MILPILLGILSLGNGYWYFRRASQGGRSMPWRIGLGLIGTGLNVIAFLNVHRFIDGNMPRWFYKMVIKNELLMISLVIILVALVVFLFGFFIRRRSTPE